MSADFRLEIYQREDLEHLHFRRAGERKAFESLAFMDGVTPEGFGQALEASVKSGVRHVVLGIPEDIGPRANLGRPGSDSAWESFLGAFINSHSNEFLDYSSVLLLGKVNVSDLMAQSAKLDPLKPSDLT
ncbi:MAG: hypothetical protein KDD53_09125, partial [Bdellovibrionales bacterium]|nr:hypothetical protein [Bdellovibrionales bacterium]